MKRLYICVIMLMTWDYHIKPIPLHPQGPEAETPRGVNIYSTNPVAVKYGADGGGLPYDPTLANSPFQCQASICPDQTAGNLLWEAGLNTSEALAVVGQSLPFVAFPQVSQYFAERRLYEQLHQDSASLLSNAALNSFYLLQQQDPTGALYRVDSLLVLLTDSLSRLDSSLFLQRLQQAQTLNSSLGTNFNVEMNEQWLNALQLKLVRFGRDSVSANDLQQLELLAKSCPMVDGQAVYKARTLYAYYEPGLTYQDFEDCNLANKGGTGPYQNILQFLHESQQNQSIEAPSEPVSIVLFPNPTSGMVHIRLEEPNSGSETIALFDLAGRVVAEHQILFSNGHGSINFQNISPGMYTCKIGKGNSAFYAKLIIATP